MPRVISSLTKRKKRKYSELEDDDPPHPGEHHHMRAELDSHADTSVFGYACLEVYGTGI